MDRLQRRDEDFFLKPPHSSCSSSEQQAGRKTDGVDGNIYLPGAELRNPDPCFLSPSLPFTPLLSIFSHPFTLFGRSFHTLLHRCEQKAADVTHYFKQRTCCTEKTKRERGDDGESGRTVGFDVFSPKRSSPATSEQMGMQSTSGYPESPPPPPPLMPVSAPNTLFYGFNPRGYKEIGVFCIYSKQIWDQIM